jgi:hypothetical protein
LIDPVENAEAPVVELVEDKDDILRPVGELGSSLD